LSRRLKGGLKNGLYYAVATFLFGLAKLLFRVRVIGRENLRPDGSYIIVARHRSYWDIPFMAIAIGAKNRIQFIARRGLMKGNPVIRLAIRAYSTIIDRENFSKRDFRRMLEAFKKERLIGFFPEGTTKRRVDAKGGAIHFASMTGKEFLPLNIKAEGPYPPRYPFRFPRVTVSIGEAFSIGALEAETDLEGEEARAKRYRMMSTRLMERVDTA
jgi:1-acyl-sn-glycerol-3-phosphate acyltransferase